MYTQILSNIQRFITLDEQEITIFTALLLSKKYKRKEFLLLNGQVAKYEIFISKGCVKNYTLDNNGFEHISMFAVEDWWTGDMASFTTVEVSKYNIIALEDTEALLISKQNMEILLEKIPKFERFFRILYQKSLTARIEKNNQNISFTAEERYLYFINKYPQFVQRISQKNIASYLGITPEFLSVMRKRLSQK